jgi:hypothetical protein
MLRRSVACCVIACVLLLAMFAVGRGDQLHGAELRVGAATVDITPPVGYRLSGYFNERVSTGTHDPLQAKAIFFEQGDQQAALVFCDLIAIGRNITQQARKLAASECGIPAENILIAATHSHTGPLYGGALRDHFHALSLAAHGADQAESVDYPAELVKKLASAIANAKKQATPAKLQAGYAEQQGLSFNRRFHMKDGSVVFNPGKLNPNIVRACGPIDPEVGLVLACDTKSDKPLAALTTFALHLDTVGGTEHSADFPFYLSRALQEKHGGDFISLFAAGTCGDINHIDVSHDRPQKGQGEAERIGSKLAATVLDKLADLSAIDKPSLATRSTVVDVPLQQYSPEEVAQAKKDIFEVGGGKLSFLEQVKAVTIVSVDKLGGPTLPLEVQVFRLSDDVALVGLPGEVFVDLGLAIKLASPFKTTIVMELCNDAPAYIPTKKAFAEGSYETINSRVQPGGGELLVDAAAKLLRDLHRNVE